ncbi:MAG TPA: hypothetical protein VFU89_07940 [Rhabdochlamydiaceae bacterium]|nr:hypothetical protein [Rhabdochlamydiaceae bacterium]
MLVGSLVNHLIHPLTYMTSQGEVKHLSTKDISHVVQLILSGLVIAIVEAVCSSRSLKSSCISVVIIIVAAFYHGAAAMKIAHRCAELEIKSPIIREAGLSTQGPTQELHQDSKSVTSTAVQQSDQVGNGVLPRDDSSSTSSTPASSTNGSSTTPAPTLTTTAAPQQVTAQRRPYKELAPSEDEASTIYNMIFTIGSLDTHLLYPKKNQLIEWGKSIAHVHPLKFLEAVLKDAVLKQAMRDIKNGFLGLKWKGFLQGEGESLGFIFKCKREDDAGDFAPYLSDFCTAVGVEFKKVDPFVKAKNWEKFISFLIQN